MNIQKHTFAAVLLLVASIAHAQTVEYIHTDALGSPVAVTNASGVVIERTVYEPYGAVLNRPLNNRPGYTGHVEDAVTGLNYMQQRYYDPQLGRFLSNDPVTASSVGGNFNRYWYANNNPYKFTDPDGRFFFLAVPVAYGLTALESAVFVSSAVVVGVGAAAVYNEVKDGSPPNPSGSGQGADSEISVGDKKPAAEGPRSQYEDSTRPRSVPNRDTDVTKGEFESELAESGFSPSQSKDGKATQWQKEGSASEYVTRDKSKTRGATAEVKVDGEVKVKIRLKESEAK
jgi:RHS repeat-associated protein